MQDEPSDEFLRGDGGGSGEASTRGPLELSSFTQALNDVDLWFAHSMTTVILAGFRRSSQLHPLVSEPLLTLPRAV